MGGGADRTCAGCLAIASEMGESADLAVGRKNYTAHADSECPSCGHLDAHMVRLCPVCGGGARKVEGCLHWY
jgi:hypothetical protein